MEQEKIEAKKASKRQKGNQITVKANKKGRHVSVLLNFFRVLLIPLVYIVKPFRFYGNRKAKDGACVYILNHYTLCDCMYVLSTTSEIVHFVAKKEVFSVPVVSFFMRKLKVIGANRDGSDVRTLLDCLKCLKNGEKIAIFPEGTRNKTKEEILPFQQGAAVLAIKAKVPIVPFAIYKKPKFFRFAHILIGDPIDLTEYYDKKLTDEEYLQINEMLQNRVLELKHNHTEYLNSKKAKKKK